MSYEKIADLLADDILNQSMEKEAFAPLIGAGVGAVKAALPKIVGAAKGLGPKMLGGAQKMGDLAGAQKNLMGVKSEAKALRNKGVVGDFTGKLNEATTARNQAFRAAKPSLINVGLVGSGAAIGSAITPKETEASINEFELEKEAGAGKAVKRYFEDLTGKTRADVLRKSQNDTMDSAADFIGGMHGQKNEQDAFVDHVMEGRKRLSNENKELARQEKSKIGTATGLGIGAGAVGAHVYQNKQSKAAGFDVYVSMLEKEAGFGSAAKEVGENLIGSGIRSTKKQVTRQEKKVNMMKNMSNKDLGMGPLDKAKAVIDEEDHLKGLKSERRKAVGKTIGAWGGIGAGAMIGHQLHEREAAISDNYLAKTAGKKETENQMLGSATGFGFGAGTSMSDIPKVVTEVGKYTNSKPAKVLAGAATLAGEASIGSILGKATGTAFDKVKNRKGAEKSAADLLFDAMIRKQAAVETMAESNIIAEASEKALNSLGFSCLQNLEKGL